MINSTLKHAERKVHWDLLRIGAAHWDYKVKEDDNDDDDHDDGDDDDYDDDHDDDDDDDDDYEKMVMTSFPPPFTMRTLSRPSTRTSRKSMS